LIIIYFIIKTKFTVTKVINDVILHLYNTKLNVEEYEFLSDFTILWGVFEYRFRIKENSLNYDRIEKMINSNQLKHIRDNTLLFNNLPEFILINFTENNFYVSFPNIDFRIELYPIEWLNELSKVKKNFKSNIEKIEKSDSKIIFLLCFISYRIRNNLFHGNKKFNELHQQRKIFEIINDFLSEILIKTKDIKSNI